MSSRRERRRSWGEAAEAAPEKKLGSWRRANRWPESTFIELQNEANLSPEIATPGRSGPFGFATGSSALIQFDRAAKEWIGLIAYQFMGNTDALFPEP